MSEALIYAQILFIASAPDAVLAKLLRTAMLASLVRYNILKLSSNCEYIRLIFTRVKRVALLQHEKKKNIFWN